MNFLAGTIVRCEQNENLNLDEEASKLADDIGWDNVLKEAYLTLSSYRVMGLWYGAACIIYYAAADGRKIPIDSNELITRLYWCLQKNENLGQGEAGFNLVWSAVAALKGVSYNSSWQPLEDPEILKIIDGFQK